MCTECIITVPIKLLLMPSLCILISMFHSVLLGDVTNKKCHNYRGCARAMGVRVIIGLTAKENAHNM